MKKEYDVLIVGSGAAGLYAALQFPENVSVLVISKRELTLSNSSLAQGGVAAVLDKSNDNFKLHIADTLIAGKYKNNLEAIEVLVSEGPSDVLRLKEMGVAFDLDERGRLQMTLEAGHSRHRIVHHKDSTGRAIVDVLIDKVRTHKNIDLYDNTMLYKLDKNEKGFYAGLLLSDGTSRVIAAHYCILASGGIGRVYQYTTNSAIATGDGITLAFMLGARIKHLSRIQFHPTAFAAENDRERFLISEAVRGEGAVLLNCDGERFAFKYDERGELAPRDVVSNAIMLESIAKGNEKFYLDITHKDPEFVKKRFPMIYEKCLEENIDITKQWIPVFPCQHYLMGGIDVDLFARTTVDRLYAAGECSHTGVHGANRLASNSLLEALVFSRRAANDITEKLQKEDNSPFGEFTEHEDLSGRTMPHGFRTEIRKLMQETYFVIPKPELIPESLQRAKDILTDLTGGEYEIDHNFVEARSLATVACIVLEEVLRKNEEQK
ncbi:MAG: L-aspartate oxidase [Clostridia bacterium]|nr:L-aspartate oxidase [Clostridia bacterium]